MMFGRPTEERYTHSGIIMAARVLGRLSAQRSALFVCDIQERFRPVISGMPAVIDTAGRMVFPPPHTLARPRQIICRTFSPAYNPLALRYMNLRLK
eukprot:scaffold118807_cov36-Prasinocladus_malaysianus.AAC.1